MVQTRYAHAAGLVAIATMVFCSCQCGSPPGAPPAASASASASAPAPEASSSATHADDDEIRPVYPQTRDPPDPVAERYCGLIYEVAETKRKECCPSTPFTSFRPTGECVRTLSYALRSKAMTVDKGELDACEAAVTAEAKQCDWGGVLPAACKGILRGQVEDMQLCRSSLECKEGRYCAGLGVSTPGKCVPSRPDGVLCGGTVDPLGAFVAQDVEGKHPQCEGYCDRRRCAAVVPVGGKCTTAIQCGAGRSCRGQKCTDAPFPGAGEPCDGGLCAEGHRCAGKTCVIERRIGEECASDAECRSTFCEITEGKKGKCAMSCQIIRTRPTGTASGSPPK